MRPSPKTKLQLLLPTLALLLAGPAAAQQAQTQAQTPAPDPWRITAGQVDPRNYYGETVANGMLGIVSSPEPFQVKSVVLAGAYDQYGRGRVSNFLNSFNLLNMYLEVDGHRIGSKDARNFRQELDMRHGALTTTFDYVDKATTKATVSYTYYALRDVQNYYNEIDRPHATLQLLTSSAKSSTGKLLL
ncbi:MAG: glycoside hydrolase family 65 protein, partial [Hymenobacter sp.]